MIFKITYAGSWLGGVAIVKADCETQALSIVANDKHTVNFKHVAIKEITSGLIYNENGSKC